MTLERVLAEWDGEGTLIRADAETGSWMVVALHSTRRGPAGGGTRLRAYADLEEAVVDAQRLASSMTLKFAVSGFPMGGGKAVLAVPQELGGEARHQLLRRYGELVHSLAGAFYTGPDVGTTPRDMDVVAETGVPFVFARTREAGGCGGSTIPTALGVQIGIEATLHYLDGAAELGGRRVAIQGVGGVGEVLVRSLVDAGAEVVATDVSESVLEALRRQGEVEIVAPDEIFDVPCDVFSPCAIGGALDAKTIPRLRCRAVVGAANNQLAEPGDAERLRERDILYAPDYAVNAGGAIWVVGVEALGWSEERADAEVRAIGETLRDIYRRAAEEGVSTEAAARQLAEQRLKSADAEVPR